MNQYSADRIVRKYTLNIIQCILYFIVSNDYNIFNVNFINEVEIC